MSFNLEKALTLPAIRDMVRRKDEVIGRFGSVFREPALLRRDDYLSFLSLRENHHWTGLERLGRVAADDMANLRAALSLLIDETGSIAARVDKALGMLHGVGIGTLTPILLLAFPDRYGVWNSTSEGEMRSQGLWPQFPRGASVGKKYEILNAVLLDLARKAGTDLWTLDALWWQSNLEKKKDDGRVYGSKERAIWLMADRAEETAKYSNGQLVQTLKKNKDLRMDKESLRRHIEALLDETGDRCAITGLLLDFDGRDHQLSPSLDRIDSNGHYEDGNLQIVAKFINAWKSDMVDREFRRLIDLLRGE
ncbi:hypothetical protein [Asaia spathodeae]|uniref:Uncharacterized protein n=1 Tax=Asaia spathodeae TaxID=657016 RepID=A0ABX2P5J5_9PROT|nr:hypothetical protein [Asaia spathodeae]